MSTGPTARAKGSPAYQRVRTTRTLLAAWQAINRNAETSGSRLTRSAAREFAKDLPANLRRIQERLRKGYKFSKAHGATPAKGKGKSGRRPIVVAPIEDRIVQRAILDVLQSDPDLPNVQAVLQTPTSIGGIPGKGVDHAIELFTQAVNEGATYVAGSDIAGFFTKIDQEEVLSFLEKSGVQPDLVALTRAALTVELSNAEQLTEELRSLFPTGTDGVAQGSPLSALAGNIVLSHFDATMNGRGIICIRYIDDFLLVGRSKDAVQKAMRSAATLLAEKGMGIYNPITNPSKAFAGAIGASFTFLGYDLIPGKYPPAQTSCKKLLEAIEAELSLGRKTIAKIVQRKEIKPAERPMIQSLVQIDRIVRGWRDSHRSSNCPELFRKLDGEIDHRIRSFTRFYRERAQKAENDLRRQAFGVSSLTK